MKVGEVLNQGTTIIFYDDCIEESTLVEANISCLANVVDILMNSLITSNNCNM